MKIALINSTKGEDYLADLFISAMLCWSKVQIYTDYIPPYIFEDYPRRNALYGKGFTAFCSVPSRMRISSNLVTLPKSQLLSFLQSPQNNDLFIVFTSIWRRSDELYKLLSYSDQLVNGKIIVLDGEDHQHLHKSSAERVLYYKRELTDLSSGILPISFCAPPTSLPFLTKGRDYIPNKTAILASCDPRFRASYTFESQSQYYRQYACSLFAVTTKKGGWDCMRHYEILANHCVPYFPNINSKPSSTMHSYPVDLQIEANRLYEAVAVGEGALEENFWLNYTKILRRFMNYFYSKCISTEYINILLRARDSRVSDFSKE
jgi:hypothetical protein